MGRLANHSANGSFGNWRRTPRMADKVARAGLICWVLAFIGILAKNC
jgi:hypothetical protein